VAVHKGQLASITTRRGIRRPELLAIGANVDPTSRFA
jgi:hypothetical protein